MSAENSFTRKHFLGLIGVAIGGYVASEITKQAEIPSKLVDIIDSTAAFCQPSDDSGFVQCDLVSPNFGNKTTGEICEELETRGAIPASSEQACNEHLQSTKPYNPFKHEFEHPEDPIRLLSERPGTVVVANTDVPTEQFAQAMRETATKLPDNSRANANDVIHFAGKGAEIGGIAGLIYGVLHNLVNGYEKVVGFVKRE